MWPVDIKLKPDIKPYASKLYNVPKAYDRIAKIEVNCLCTNVVLANLSHTTDSPWAAPSLCREVNKCIQRKPFPLLRIHKSLQKIEKFKSAMTIGLSQGYYSIPLSEKSQKICTTILPWG